MAELSIPDGGDTIGPLPRRAAAAAIDIAAVSLPSFLLVRTVAERFPIETLDDGTKRLADDDVARIEEIGDGFNRTLEFAGTLYTLSGLRVWLLLFGIAVLAALVFVVMPSRAAGRTPGKRVLKLRTVDENGQAATIGSLTVRTVVGIADLIPFVIPGALGAYLASTDELGRRLGDRLARTLVVDTTSDVQSDEDEWFTYRGTVVGRSPADEDAIDLGRRLESMASSPVTTDVAPDPDPDPDTDTDSDTDTDTDEALHAHGAEPGHSTIDDAYESTIEPGDGRIENATGAEVIPRDESAPDPDVDQYHRPFLDELFEGTEPAANPDASPVSTLERTQPEATGGEVDLEATVDGPTLDEPRGDERSTPETELDVAATIEPATATEAGFEAPTTTADAADTDSATGQTEPEWNEAWKAWMYWDRETKRWFRHDDETGKWKPLP